MIFASALFFTSAVSRAAGIAEIQTRFRRGPAFCPVSAASRHLKKGLVTSSRLLGKLWVRRGGDALVASPTSSGSGFSQTRFRRGQTKSDELAGRSLRAGFYEQAAPPFRRSTCAHVRARIATPPGVSGALRARDTRANTATGRVSGIFQPVRTCPCANTDTGRISGICRAVSARIAHTRIRIAPQYAGVRANTATCPSRRACCAVRGRTHEYSGRRAPPRISLRIVHTRPRIQGTPATNATPNAHAIRVRIAPGSSQSEKKCHLNQIKSRRIARARE